LILLINLLLIAMFLAVFGHFTGYFHHGALFLGHRIFADKYLFYTPTYCFTLLFIVYYYYHNKLA